MNIQFSFDKLILPINYNHIIQAFILQLINDAEYRKFIHNQGYLYNKRSYKMFSFSRLNGEFKINPQDKTIEFFENVNLKISSLDENIIRYVADSLLFKSEFELINQKIYVKKIEYKDEEIHNNHLQIKTLSPITVYSTIQKDSSKKTIYYSPSEKEFSKLIIENLKSKYLAFYKLDKEKAPFNENFVIKEKNGSKSKLVITYYKNFIIKGWHGLFEIKGDPRLLKIGYDAGFGAKNSQGFGLVEIL